MKDKTSITLSEDLLKMIDQRIGLHKNRSDFIETIVRIFITQSIRDEQNRKDLEIINDNAERLNEEATDVLIYQMPL